MSDPFSRRGFTRAALGAAALWALPSPMRAQERATVDLEVVLSQRTPRPPGDLVLALRVRASRRVELPLGRLSLRGKLVHDRETPITLAPDPFVDEIQARYSPNVAPARYRTIESGRLAEFEVFRGRWPDGVHEGILRVRIVARQSTLVPLGPASALLGRELSLAVSRDP